MQDIVSQVKQVNDLTAEIGSDRVDQAQGVSQVGDPVNPVNQVMQQNVALVEESAAAVNRHRQQLAVHGLRSPDLVRCRAMTTVNISLPDALR